MDPHRNEEFYAIVAPGLEETCAGELAGMGIASPVVTPGGVTFPGRLADLYRVSLNSRIATRVVVRFARFRCRDFPELYRQGCRLPWGRFVRPGSSLAFRVTCHNSRLMHSDRIAETLQAAADHALGGGAAPATAFRQQVLVRMVDDMAELSIDSSGELLHRRGYRTSIAAAPLRETLAAGVLRLLGWTADEALADPLCGTGTFLLEGAMMAVGRAPGLHRSFAFMHWPGYRAGLWQQLCAEAQRAERPCPVAISGGDADADTLLAARANLAQAGLEDAVTLQVEPLAAHPVHPGGGLVLCNPPYGRRLTTVEPLVDYFSDLGRELQRAYPGWRKALLCPDAQLAGATGLPLRKVAEVDNGGLRVGLFATG